MGEPGQQEPAGPGVQGRIGRDGGQPVGEDGLLGLLAVEGDDGDLEGAEVLDVVGDGGHVVVAGGEPVAAPAVGVGDGARRAQLVPDAEGIGHVAGVENVEIGGPVGDRCSF